MNNISNGKKINPYCNTEKGSFDNPILLLNNFKEIGMHYRVLNKKLN